ncbi:hypothetical protein ABZP36_029461 [Zizania latifolia]
MMAGLFQSSGWPSMVAGLRISMRRMLRRICVGAPLLVFCIVPKLTFCQTLFHVGGVGGGILADHISNRLDAQALTVASFTFMAIPALFFYRIYGSVSLY